MGTTQAQIMAVPQRHRSKTDLVKSHAFGREQRQQIGQQQQQRRNASLRKLEGKFSMPLEEMEMSIPEFELSMSMPIGSIDSELGVAIGGDGSNGHIFILASLFAGLSALVIGAAAIFVKSRRRKNDLYAVGSQEADGMEIRAVSQTIQDDFCDVEIS